MKDGAIAFKFNFISLTINGSLTLVKLQSDKINFLH
jgi:hypothetical protein